MALIRRTIHVVAWIGTLLVALLALALIVSQTPWFRDWIRRTIIREAKQYLNGELTHRAGHRQPVLRFRSCRRRRGPLRRAHRRDQGARGRLQRLPARLQGHRRRPHHADGAARAPRARRRRVEHRPAGEGARARGRSPRSRPLDLAAVDRDRRRRRRHRRRLGSDAATGCRAASTISMCRPRSTTSPCISPSG